jgi:hypothetical protein
VILACQSQYGHKVLLFYLCPYRLTARRTNTALIFKGASVHFTLEEQVLFGHGSKKQIKDKQINNLLTASKLTASTGHDVISK